MGPQRSAPAPLWSFVAMGLPGRLEATYAGGRTLRAWRKTSALPAGAAAASRLLDVEELAWDCLNLLHYGAHPTIRLFHQICYLPLLV